MKYLKVMVVDTERRNVLAIRFSIASSLIKNNLELYNCPLQQVDLIHHSVH